jgi:hypothetical protein
MFTESADTKLLMGQKTAITLFDCFSKWRLRMCAQGCITCRKETSATMSVF